MLLLRNLNPDIMKIIEIDAPFYQRGNIDRAPVSVSGGDDHE